MFAGDDIRMWKRGLLWLPVFYLASTGVIWFLHVEKAALKSVQVELTAALEEIDAVLRQPGKVRLEPGRGQELNARLDELEARARQHLGRVYLFAAGAGVLCLLFIWATWQVTAGDRGRMESWARWAVILHPILAAAEAITPGIGLRLVIQAARVIVLVGHQLAAMRIARSTGNFWHADSLHTLFKTFEYLLVGFLIIVFIGQSFLAAWGLAGWLMPALYAVAGIYLLTLSWLLLSLRRKIV